MREDSKTQFTPPNEIIAIKKLVTIMANADKDGKKTIRRYLRKIGFYMSDFDIRNCQVSDIDRLIMTGEIKPIDDSAPVKKAPVSDSHTSVEKKTAPQKIIPTTVYVETKDAEKALIKGHFVAVNDLDNYSVPAVSGLYCIKLRKGVVLSAKYGKVRDDGIIYIGKGDSLRERLWQEELNHRRPATFFRGIGAMLDYLPPKGSLTGKSNQNNYEFSDEDTEAIKKWMRQSLFVSWIAVEQEKIKITEKELIKKYQPLMNYIYNPNKSKELAAAGERCREYAKSK